MGATGKMLRRTTDQKVGGSNRSERTTDAQFRHLAALSEAEVEVDEYAVRPDFVPRNRGHRSTSVVRELAGGVSNAADHRLAGEAQQPVTFSLLASPSNDIGGALAASRMSPMILSVDLSGLTNCLQQYSLGSDVVVAARETASGNDVDTPAQQLLKVSP